ncbi:MAG: bifunctional phosphopantothenoylcysteine decarboxylase/phosphopantothenate--cysteine ligase CoaBC [Paludibacteraceae bacterium]|nr:bifunctional phosphopantothenoylcysteine decarboxylase/phosphopantothenate--cysteine ligase CoaBC [Paludibacteraceae bacterium]
MALQGKHILVGISGGIAAYKIPELIRGLVKAGAEVRVATTRHALEFVTELTLQTISGHPVYSDVFAAINAHATEHISLPEWCDAMIVAPATANVVAKMAAGIADDALTTTICSCVARKPILIAPAMNDKMWENPATQHAIETIRSWQNVRVIEPAEGPLACGVVGKGRMPEAEELQEALEYALTPPTLTGQRILITAGGTQEPIDPVRFISNYSTGKMGVALAQVCARRGAEVTMVCGSMSVTPRNPFGAIHRIDALSAQEMYEACIAQWPRMNSAILCAAVADFTPCEKAENKIKKGDRSLVNGDRSLVNGGKPSSAERSRTSSVSREDAPGEWSLSLKETADIAKALGQSKRPDQKLIGFALETQHEIENALHKMERKNLDAIVLNSLRDKGAGFGVDTNRVTIIRADGNSLELPLLSKAEAANEIIRYSFLLEEAE